MNYQLERLRHGVRSLVEVLAPGEQAINNIETFDEARARLIDLGRDLLALTIKDWEAPDTKEMTVRELLTKVLKENEELKEQVTRVQQDNWEKLQELRSSQKALAEMVTRYDNLARHLGEK